jgi:hypothetical protein
VAPPLREAVRALGHVASELCHLFPGEHRLQCAQTGQPRFVFEVEERTPEESSVFVDGSLPMVHQWVAAAEYVASTAW